MTTKEAFENRYEQQMQLLAKTLLELNLCVETTYRILLDKGICTDKDIKETREELLKSDDDFRESFEKIGKIYPTEQVGGLLKDIDTLQEFVKKQEG